MALSGVSCTSATSCTAVGSYDDSSAETSVTLAERWDGTSWTIQNTPNPANVHGSFLSGVSCTSATACTAVGNAAVEMLTVETLAEHWDGTSWTIETTPNASGADAKRPVGGVVHVRYRLHRGRELLQLDHIIHRNARGALGWHLLDDPAHP